MDLVFKLVEYFALFFGTLLELFVSRLTSVNTTQTSADGVKPDDKKK
jgi:hypothetical protein